MKLAVHLTPESMFATICLWFRNNFYPPNLIYRFEYKLYQNLKALFAEIYRWILKFMWKYKKPNIVKIILKRKKKIEDFLS